MVYDAGNESRIVFIVIGRCHLIYGDLDSDAFQEERGSSLIRETKLSVAARCRECLIRLNVNDQWRVTICCRGIRHKERKERNRLFSLIRLAAR